ncbi:MAG TPA: alpha-E domain-containing protein [Candidatus Mediterraneibacter cottocaccae]|nr:alpha-E domain-containing protein [Candidatus Mediterraneibacter cottocaccae]
MGIISVEKVDHLYWLGRYTERVYTTLRVFFHIYDHIIEQPEGIYTKYCERLNIPDIYTSNRQFVQSYLFGEDNPDSVYSNMKRAYDNAVVLRDELSSTVLSYVQLALDTFEACRKTTAPLLELQQVIDDLLAFWGGADDYVEEEDCRNILKCGKYVERLDLCIRLDYHAKDLEKEYRKLCNRLKRTNLGYNEHNLKRLEDIIIREEDPKSCYPEALRCLGGLPLS